MTEEKKFEFSLDEQEELPEKSYIKQSPYDKVIEAYMDLQTDKPVRLSGIDKKASYLKGKIMERIKKLELENEITAIVRNAEVYLMKAEGE